MEFKSEEEMWVTIGLNVKQFRERAGITREDLANKAAISFSYLKDIELPGNRVAHPSLGTLRSLAIALNINVVDLLLINSDASEIVRMYEEQS